MFEAFLLRSRLSLVAYIEDRLGPEGTTEIAGRMADYLSDRLWDELGYRIPTSSQFQEALSAVIEG
jgi:hypothetical protein